MRVFYTQKRRVFNARGGQVSEKGEKREHGGGLGHTAAIFETIKVISRVDLREWRRSGEEWRDGD
jgi:hypothetical protein